MSRALPRRSLFTAAAVGPLGILTSSAAHAAPGAPDSPWAPSALEAPTGPTVTEDPADPGLSNPMPPGFSIGVPLARAHAHNDYLHPRPLWDALAHGFTSIEADVWFRDGRLLLGHTVAGTMSGRGFEQWYLQPLAAWIRAHHGQVFPDWGGTVQLLVDIKEEGTRSLLALEKMLARYADVLWHIDGGHVVPGPLRVVYTGNRPFSAIAGAPLRFGSMDGHEGDLGGAADPARIPLVSESWSLLGWQGIGRFPAEQRERLEGFVAAAHDMSARARFWGAPSVTRRQRAAIWDAQLDAGVDLIGADHLAELRDHLSMREEP